MQADVPGHDLLAGHVIDRREIGLGAATLNSVTSVLSFSNGLSARKSRLGRFGTRSPSSPLYELYFLQGFAARIRT